MLFGSLPQLFAGDRGRMAVSCPVEPEDLAETETAEFFCTAPDEQTALALQESLVLADVGSNYCVPGPWEGSATPDQRRALLTLRIAQHRVRTAGELTALPALIEERAADPEFDRATVELLIRGDQEATHALAARVGGDLANRCRASLVQEVVRNDMVVSFRVRGSVGRAADHLCKLGCEVAYR